ncbi:alanine--tRNA ligase [Patescibacteria group bacterium]|nr:alanine--tRNA ligase [Patescibacteria group bacterium]
MVELMTADEVRSRYLTFFKKRGHIIIPSASLVPENDPTTLFTGSGMQPLLPYLLGEKHPQGDRLVDSQKCLRAEDIEEVGDNRHTTFFEMLGNWSLGSYFKKEQLSWLLEFLTEEINIPKKRLWVTCFEGDEKLHLPRDNQSAAIWKELGIPEERICFYGSKKNWWSRAGEPENMPKGEPGGPDSEIFYDFGTVHDPAFGENCNPNCDCGRFLEIGNSVFMEYIKQEDSSFKELPQKNVDFGGGLERLTAAANNDPDVFNIDVLRVVIQKIEQLSKKQYTNTTHQKSFRVIADHLRGAVFMIGDGVFPSNTGEGYILRRLLRRAVRHADVLGMPGDSLKLLVQGVVTVYKGAYPNLVAVKQSYKIEKEISGEEEVFRMKLQYGMKKFEAMAMNKAISGEDAFQLFSTHGFPFELTLELAKEKGISVDEKEFRAAMQRHQGVSRKGAEKKFKGGLADHSALSIKYHTATHLLHQALRDILGKHVFQKGSNITGERLRFDFSHSQKMTDEEKKQVEDLVNQKIRDELPVSYEDIPAGEAVKLGAIGLFEKKYGDKVRVYKIGGLDVESGKVYSLEYCGGPHVENTKSLGHFKIKKEEAVSAGVRRIKAVLE